MKNTMITELVTIKVLETTTEGQMLNKADFLTNFLKKQDGYIDGELVKGIDGNTWCFIYHFESFEKVKAIGEKMRNERVFDMINPLVVPGGMTVTFYNPVKKW